MGSNLTIENEFNKLKEFLKKHGEKEATRWKIGLGIAIAIGIVTILIPLIK